MKPCTRVLIVSALLTLACLWILTGPDSRPTDPVASAPDRDAGTLGGPSAATVAAAEALAVSQPGNPVPAPVARLARPAACVDFLAWASTYTNTPPADRPALLAEGRALAQARLTALADLIPQDPESALANELPYALRKALPPELQPLLEERVSRRADFEVVGLVPEAGRSMATPVVRSVDTAEGRYQVFAYGEGAQYYTRTNFPVSGIAVPVTAASRREPNPLFEPVKLMALRPNPARLVETAEVDDVVAKLASEPICSVSGQPVLAQGTPAGVELGGVFELFDQQAHAEDYQQAVPRRQHLHGTGLPVAAAGGDGVVGEAPIAYAYNSIGTKRYLFLRVRFTDGSYTIGSNTAVTLLNNLSNFYATMSYGKLLVAPVTGSPSSGSAVTPELQLPEAAAFYDNAGLSKLYPAALSAARAAGYNPDNYHFACVFTSGKPAAGYAGVAYVGAKGAHMANGYFSESVTSHELGHNLGLYHAHYWDTDDKSTIGDGTSVEYGGPYDVMGGGGYSAGHYSAGHKRVLGWITDAMGPLAPAGRNTYRLYVHDNQGVNNLVTALRASRSGKDYHVEYRQRYSGDNLRNGVILTWCDDGGNNATVLDARPGESGDALHIGRTFSDPGANVHITPVARGNVTPDWVDVVVHTGSTSGNLQPVVRVAASQTQAATGQSINFTATATDGNGDALAYYWEFGDGGYTTSNDPEVSRSYSAAGEYAVQCVVSDMRGGKARDTVLVRVGSPSTFRISGRVLDQNQQPVVGIRVKAGSKWAHTDSDGTYAIVGLAAGSYTVSAAEMVSANTSFLKPFFSNPVTVGPSFTTADFITGTDPPDTFTTLVSSNATWRYLDDGSDPGTAWRASSFDASAWKSGAAILGYGQSNETTVLNYGPDPTNKFVSYYFRRTFTVANPAAYPSYRLQVLRDDGFVAYLNGAEIWRDNLPTGEVTAATLALDSTEPDSWLARTLNPAQLVAGTNTLAVEVHQVQANSSDLNFGLILGGLSPSSATGQKLVYLTAPTTWTFVAGPTNVPLAATALAEGATVTRVDFYRGTTKLGEDAASPYTLTWTNAPVGTNSIRAVALFSTGLSATSAPVAVVVTPLPVSLALITTGSVWRYHASNAAPAGTWKTAAYNDAAWASGPAELGYGDGDEATVLPFGGNTTNRWVSTYYRRAFHVGDPYSVTNLTAQLRRDDGAVLYLNGVEVARDGMPAGTISYGTWATNSVNGTDETVFVPHTLPQSLLVPGTNVLAVELHQVTNNSSDISFDLALTSLGATNRAPGAWLTSPLAGTTYTLPATVPLAAQATVAANAGLSRVEFHAGTTKVGEDTTFPYTFNWSPATAGTLTLRAIAIDTTGASVTSAPVSIVLRAPSPETALVSFGSVWRYLDTGIGPATNWTGSSAFDDSTWRPGPAPLGYGGDGEATQVGFGPDSSAKHPTTWFRHRFNIGDPAAFSALRLRVRRDDGVAVYLNGTEVLRNNLPSGPLASNTFATVSVGGADEYTPIESDLTNTLRAGENVLAAEVHQYNLTSSDLGFDLSLVGLRTTNLTQGVFLTAPAAGERFTEGAPVPLECFATSPAGVTRVDYLANGTVVATAGAIPYPAAWTNAPRGTHALTAHALLGNGLTLTSPPVLLTVAAPAYASALVAPGATWRYHDEGLDLGTAWREDGFEDATWDVGAARLGFGDTGTMTTLSSNRSDASRIITYYFRQNFEVTPATVVTSLVLRVQRDDAAVVYLNGVEAWRDTNMPPGTVTASTLALVAMGGTGETAWFSAALDPSLLRPGLNLIAAEVHQNSATSSDLGFDLDLTALGYVENNPPSPPALALAHDPVLGRLTLAWPEGGNWIPQATPSLTPPVTWAPLTNAPTLIGGEWRLTVPMSPTGRWFYRLQSPQ